MSKKIIITLSGVVPETWDKEDAEITIRQRLFGTPFGIEKTEEVEE